MSDEVANPEAADPNPESTAAPLPGGLLHSKRFWSVLMGILVAVTVAVWCNPFFGGEWNHVVESGPVNFRPNFHINYGSSSVFAMAGQTITVDCQAEIKAGGMTLWIRHAPFLPKIGEAPLQSLELRQSQHTTVQAVAPETGFYRIVATTWRERNECDIQYELNWHVR